MRKLICLLLLCLLFLAGATPGVAATNATAVWEVRSTGNATNGGGYDSGISGAGTDMSVFDNKNAASCTSCQSATVNISTSDAVTNNTTTVTSATANFSSALIGNVIRLSGTGTTTGWYWVTAVGSSTSITVDRATGSTGGTGVTMNIGGALSKPGDLTTNSLLVAGNTVYVKATGTYSIASSPSFSASGSSGLPITLIGYTSTRTDNGMPTMQPSTTGINLLGGSGSMVRVRNFILDCNGQGTSKGINLTGAQWVVSHVKVTNCTVNGILTSGSSVSLSDVWITGSTSAATAGALGVSGGQTLIMNSRITGNVAPGIVSSNGTMVVVNTIVDNNTGASSDGIQVTDTTASHPQILINVASYANGRDGLRATAAASADNLMVTNSIFYGNSGVQMNSATTTWPSGSLNLACNAYSSGGLSGLPAGAGDKTLTADPFGNGASNDFTLNSTSGGGALLKSAGCPGAFQSGGTGYMDIGPLQAQPGGGTFSYPIIGMVRRIH